MKAILALSIFLLGFGLLPQESFAQTQSFSNANTALQVSQGDRGRYCSNQYSKQKVPQNQQASFIAQCMQPQSTRKARPMTPAEMAAYHTKSRNCSNVAKDKNLTGNARSTFIQSCLNQ